MAKSFDSHPGVPGSNPSDGNFFKKSTNFLNPRGFQKFWQKTWNEQLLFCYSRRRGENRIIAPSSGSILYTYSRSKIDLVVWHLSALFFHVLCDGVIWHAKKITRDNGNESLKGRVSLLQKAYYAQQHAYTSLPNKRSCRHARLFLSSSRSEKQQSEQWTACQRNLIGQSGPVIKTVLTCCLIFDRE